LASKDGEKVLRFGFFHGYTLLTWSCIAMNAFGGLLVGAVINYCDAIQKDMAIGASIVVSAIGSMYLFDFQPQSGFALGVVLVSYAVPLYAGRAGDLCSAKCFMVSVSHHSATALVYFLKQYQFTSVASKVESLKTPIVDAEMISESGSEICV
jgi:hypothetical protein